MPASSTTTWTPRLMIRVGAISAALAVAATVATVSGSGQAGPATPAAATTAASPTPSAAAPARAAALSVPQTTPATFFRPATFNVLGADHTAPGGRLSGGGS